MLRASVASLRQHEFIVEWRPAIFDVVFDAEPPAREMSGRELSSSVDSSSRSDNSFSFSFSNFSFPMESRETLEASTATRQFVAAAACSDLMKTIESISAYEEDDFIYNRCAMRQHCARP